MKKVTWPGFEGYKSKEDECRPSKIPRCKSNNDAQKFRLCSCRVLLHQVDLSATLYEQELVKRCETLYVTECAKQHGGYGKPRCTTRPVQVG